jgi:hypothetical protein
MKRREMLQGSAALGLVMVTASAAQELSGERLRLYRRLRFAMHEDVFFWWLRGTKFGVIDARVTPLYNMEIASIFRCKAGAGDEFSVTSLELVYNTDLKTGQPLTQWRNPYTDEMVAMRPADPVGPVTVPYRASGPELPTSLPGASLRHEHHTEFLDGDGDTQLLRDESVAVVTRLGTQAPDFLVNDLSTYQASKRDLANKRLLAPPASVAFTAVSNWQLWMKMGERPGSLLSRAVGRKVARLADCPRSYMDLLARFHPDILRDPQAALARPQARFER